MAYELGTAKTMDSAVPKWEDLSGDLPTKEGGYSIQNVYGYLSAGELILVAENPAGDSQYYRSVNDGRSWDLFWETGQIHQGEGFETAGGSLLFSSAGDTYRYTGGGETPSQVSSISGFGQGATQTNDGTIYLCEYGTGGNGNHTDIYKSTDDGQTFDFVVNVKNATGEDMRHLHGIASQGTDRLFVATGDTNHEILETDDEFSTYERYIWKTGGGDPANKATSYTGIHCENNALILGADHTPARLTYMWVGGERGDIPTILQLGGGTHPMAMFHVMVPPKLNSDAANTDSRYNYNNIRTFFHRIKSDGNMLYAHGNRGNILAVSTTGGRTWKWIETPIGGEPALGRDSVYVYGVVRGVPKLHRIPKESLWNYPEEDTQIYHLLREATLGDANSANNAIWFGRDLPFQNFTDFRFGVTTDGTGKLRLWEDTVHGTAIATFDSKNAVVDADLTSGFNEVTLSDFPNGGFSMEIFETESAQALTIDCFVQAHR